MPGKKNPRPIFSAITKKLIKLKKLVNNRVKLSAEDRLWLAVMENRYKVIRGDLGALELGMDIIPPSLALAQAAE